MKRLVFLVILLLVLLVVPLTAHAQDATPEATATPPPESAEAASSGTFDAVSKALGTLAVYAAIIAALAAGTEVITDLLRPFFGLERQPQAMETFAQMQAWLPQTLEEMGADPQAQARLQSALDQLDSTVKEFAQVASGEKIAQAIQKWALGAIKSVGAATAEQLEAKLQELGTQLKEEYNLADDVVEQALDSANQILEALKSGESLDLKLGEFKDLLKGLGLDLSQIDAAVTQALQAAGTAVGDEQLQRQLKELLKGLGVPPAQIDAAIAQALGVLNAIKEAQGAREVIKLASSLDSYGNLLDAVDGQRAEVIGSLRKVWRALRDWDGLGLTRRFGGAPEWFRARSLLGALLYILEKGWNWLRGRGGVEEGLIYLLTPENAAQLILDLDRQHHLTESRRQRILRFVTVIIGIALAVIVQIDSLDLLKPLFTRLPEALFDPNEHAYTLAQILGWEVSGWWASVRWLFTWMAAATPGMLLSGLAASAGSSFWHDQLDRLRAAKRVTEEVQTVVGQMQGAQGNQS
ncbi:MAG: hypothetical protein PVF47_21795 [Anaerolineae bacterium]